MKRVAYHLSVWQIERLKRLSEKTDTTVAELIRRFVDAGLAKAERQGGRKDEGPRA